MAARPYSRKSKSLGLLATRFVDMCRDLDDGLISLDAASKTLAVVRRRIYDVVNVLQSIGIVAREGKNTYSWQGAKGMRSSLQDMNKQIEDEGNDEEDEGAGTKRGESLGALSRKFVSLFLQNQDSTVLSLESAAAEMHSSLAATNSTPEKGGATKTKVRRLYDVRYCTFTPLILMILNNF